jgi:hypothetical protein
MKIIIFLILVFILFINYNINYNINNNNNNNNTNLPIKNYYRNNKIGFINEKIFKKYNIFKTDKLINADLYIPTTYTYCETEFKNIYYKKFVIYMIHGCDYLASKNMLYEMLEKTYNRKRTKHIVPETWIFNNKKHMELFKKDYDSNTLYILKKNVQQKKGLYLTNNYNNIIHNKNNHKIIQKYIDDTFLINKRKITLRIYLLIVYKNNKLFYYVHKNGKCLYTTKNYISNKNKINYNSLITSDPSNLNINIYDTNPHTLFDLKKYLNEHNYNYNLLYKNILKNLKLLIKSYNTILYKKNKICKNVCFQLFGLDYIFNNKLNVYLLEINKGPNMSHISKKDYKLKYNILEDVFDKVNLIKKTNKNLFISI